MTRAALTLAALALRRTLPPALVLAVVLVLAAAILPGAELPPTVAVAADGFGRMLARARVWWLTGLLALVACVPRAALLGVEARSVRGDLLAASSLPRSLEVLATWCGVTAAGAGTLLLGLVAAELAAGGTGPAAAEAAQLANPAIEIPADGFVAYPLGARAAALAEPGARLVVELLSIPGAARTATVRGGLGAATPPDAVTSVLVDARARLVLVPGAGPPPEALWLSRAADRAGALVPSQSLRVLRSAPHGERSAGLRMLLSGSLALAAAAALALGLGSWLQAWIASAGVLALALVPRVLGVGTLPGARLGALLAGEVPPTLHAGEAAGLALVVLLGLGLAAAGRGRRRTA